MPNPNQHPGLTSILMHPNGTFTHSPHHHHHHLAQNAHLAGHPSLLSNSALQHLNLMQQTQTTMSPGAAAASANGLLPPQQRTDRLQVNISTFKTKKKEKDK
jgi:hypothetical protein